MKFLVIIGSLLAAGVLLAILGCKVDATFESKSLPKALGCSVAWSSGGSAEWPPRSDGKCYMDDSVGPKAIKYPPVEIKPIGPEYVPFSDQKPKCPPSGNIEQHSRGSNSSNIVGCRIRRLPPKGARREQATYTDAA